MRITSLTVENFRAARRVHLESLGDTVVIAGPNGSGKSCLFHAIRLLKSAYGGYQPNEWHQWLAEFGINVERSQEALITILRDRTKPLRISAEFDLTSSERDFLRQEAARLTLDAGWRRVTPTNRGPGGRFGDRESIATRDRTYGAGVQARAQDETQQLIAELAAAVFSAELTMTPRGPIEVKPSIVLEYVFSIFRPDQLGVVDFQSPHRNYAREDLGGINLSREDRTQRMQQHALYNSEGRYSNLKSEMASQYIRAALVERSGIPADGDTSLGETLNELFRIFFPGKTFLGPSPTEDGRLDFPVRLQSGEVHDINELSSGEKEVLYGYLRLRHSNPRNSILLIDEPELHLNPRLVRGLALFYQRHLGKALSNQLWLLTHSDTLLKDAIGQQGFSVFHLRPPESIDEGQNQSSVVSADDDIETLLIQLVGAAGYKPSGTVLILEGGGDSEFDVRMTSILFPELQREVMLVSGDNKARVHALHEALEAVQSKASLFARFFSITDRDSEPPRQPKNRRALVWNVYHIENYLLEPRFLLKASLDVSGGACTLRSETEVLNLLKECAEKTMPDLVRHALHQSANGKLRLALTLRVDKTAVDVSKEISRAVLTSTERIGKIVASELSLAEIELAAAKLRAGYEADLASDRWRATFRGRDILRRFVDSAGLPVGYVVFRHLVLAAMRDQQYKPPGMRDVLANVTRSVLEAEGKGS